jgi:hypothetical protein
LGGGAFFLADKDKEALASVFLNGQRPVMVAVGRRWLFWFWTRLRQRLL